MVEIELAHCRAPGNGSLKYSGSPQVQDRKFAHQIAVSQTQNAGNWALPGRRPTLTANLAGRAKTIGARR